MWVFYIAEHNAVCILRPPCAKHTTRLKRDMGPFFDQDKIASKEAFVLSLSRGLLGALLARNICKCENETSSFHIAAATTSNVYVIFYAWKEEPYSETNRKRLAKQYYLHKRLESVSFCISHLSLRFSFPRGCQSVIRIELQILRSDRINVDLFEKQRVNHERQYCRLELVAHRNRKRRHRTVLTAYLHFVLFRREAQQIGGVKDRDDLSDSRRPLGRKEATARLCDTS